MNLGKNTDNHFTDMDSMHSIINGNGHGSNTNTTNNGVREVECRVCGDKASGKHYGVPSCDGCRGFFKRSIRRNLDYICKENGNCIVDVTRRNQCQSCRFKKCLHVNMKRDAVQHERAPRINGLHKSRTSISFHSTFSPATAAAAAAAGSLFFPTNSGHSSFQNHHHQSQFQSQQHHILKHFPNLSSQAGNSSVPGVPSVSGSLSSMSLLSLPPPPPSALGFYPLSGSGTNPGPGSFPLFPLSTSAAAARLMFSTFPPFSFSTGNSNMNIATSGNESDDEHQSNSTASIITATAVPVPAVAVSGAGSSSSVTVITGSNVTTSSPTKEKVGDTIRKEQGQGTREEEVSTTTNNDQLDFSSVSGTGTFNPLLASTSVSPSNSNENIYEAAAKLLFLSIKWARTVPSFCTLPSADQCALLAHSWSELFVLSAIQCGLQLDEDSFFIGKSIGQLALAGAKRLSDLLTRISTLSPDQTELACMKAVVLFKPEAGNLSSTLRIELLQDQTMIMLQEYCFAKSPLNKIRFGKLLMLFPLLKTITSNDLEELFFKQTVGEVSIQKLIIDLVKATF